MTCVHAHDSPVLEICGCGRIYLTDGPVTVTFQYAEFVSFAHNEPRLADSAVEQRGARMLADTYQTH